MSKRITIMIDGEKVTATPELLNRISIWVQEAAESPCNRTVSDIYKRIGLEIYEQLDALGIYDVAKREMLK